MHRQEHPYPASAAFLLDNPFRRLIQPPSRLIDRLNIEDFEVIVDFGCGPGYYTVELAKRAKQVIAVDVSSDMLKKAENKIQHAGANNVLFLQSSGTRIQLESASVDVVLLITVYHEVAEPEATLAEFRRILKPHGKLIIAEVIKRGLLSAAPLQNPKALEEDVMRGGFKLQKTLPYDSYGVFFFSKPI